MFLFYVIILSITYVERVKTGGGKRATNGWKVHDRIQIPMYGQAETLILTQTDTLKPTRP